MRTFRPAGTVVASDSGRLDVTNATIGFVTNTSTDRRGTGLTIELRCGGSSPVRLAYNRTTDRFRGWPSSSRFEGGPFVYNWLKPSGLTLRVTSERSQLRPRAAAAPPDLAQVG